jgi:uncharacterized RDD family membrane protein YckC
MIDAAACAGIAQSFTTVPSSAYNAAVFVIFIAERILFTSLTGASFGQFVVRERVVRLDRRRVGPLTATLRTLLLALLVPVFLVGQDGRGLHDRVAGTDVVRL